MAEERSFPQRKASKDAQRTPPGYFWLFTALSMANFLQINSIFISNEWLAGGRGRKDTYRTIAQPSKKAINYPA